MDNLECIKCSSMKSGYFISSSILSNNLAFCLFGYFSFQNHFRPNVGIFAIFCQAIMIGVTGRYNFLYYAIQSNVSPSLRVLLLLSITVSYFWNLQFFKTIIPSFCITEKLTGTHVHMLNWNFNLKESGLSQKSGPKLVVI